MIRSFECGRVLPKRSGFRWTYQRCSAKEKGEIQLMGIAVHERRVENRHSVAVQFSRPVVAPIVRVAGSGGGAGGYACYFSDHAVQYQTLQMQDLRTVEILERHSSETSGLFFRFPDCFDIRHDCRCRFSTRTFIPARIAAIDIGACMAIPVGIQHKSACSAASI